MVASRPVSGVPIASVWGQDIHDREMTPRGCIFGGPTLTLVSGRNVLPINAAPLSGENWRHADGASILIPVGAGGLYHMWANGSITMTGTNVYNRFDTAGSAGSIGLASVAMLGSTAAFWSGGLIVPLADGHMISIGVAVNSAGSAGLHRFGLVRIGDAFPAAALARPAIISDLQND